MHACLRDLHQNHTGHYHRIVYCSSSNSAYTGSRHKEVKPHSIREGIAKRASLRRPSTFQAPHLPRVIASSSNYLTPEQYPVIIRLKVSQKIALSNSPVRKASSVRPLSPVTATSQAGRAGEVPVGAVLVHQGEVISARGNAMESTGDPTCHAELQVLQDAVSKIGRFKLPECTLYVTLEPCPMCAGAMLQARVGTLVYAAKNPLLGADGSWICILRSGEGESLKKPHPFHPKMQIRSGVLEEAGNSMLKEFFRLRRRQPSRHPKFDASC